MLIDQIIELKKACKNTFGETYAQLLRHYKIVMAEGRIELLMAEGQVTGFLEWIRQPHLSFPLRSPDYMHSSGKYLYIINAVVKKGNLWELIKRVRKKTKSCEKVVWDNKGSRHIYTMKGKNYANRFLEKE